MILDKQNSTKTVSFRLTPEMQEMLTRAAQRHQLKSSALIKLAIERCLLDDRWNASPGHSAASEREKALYQDFSDLCQVVTDLQFCIAQVMQPRSTRAQRQEAKAIAEDATMRLNQFRKAHVVR